MCSSYNIRGFVNKEVFVDVFCVEGIIDIILIFDIIVCCMDCDDKWFNGCFFVNMNCMVFWSEYWRIIIDVMDLRERK